MHNTHYIIIKAENASEAGYKVDSELDDFGNENNYHRIDRISCLTDDEDKEYVEQELKELNRVLSKENEIKEHIKKLQDKVENGGNKFLYYELSQCYKNLYEMSHCVNKVPYTYDHLKNREIEDYYGWQFDEYGITDMVYDEDLEENDKIFFVTIDMHS